MIGAGNPENSYLNNYVNDIKLGIGKKLVLMEHVELEVSGLLGQLAEDWSVSCKAEAPID